jgi:hypothetical protein
MLVIFPRQYWFFESPSLLCNKYVASLVGYLKLSRYRPGQALGVQGV